MFCANDFCVSLPLLLLVGGLVVVGFAIVISVLSRRNNEELNDGGNSMQSQSVPDEPEEEDEDAITDESEYINAKKGDKLPFYDWVFEVTGIDDSNDKIFGNLNITLPPGAKYLSMTRQQAESYPAGILGFTITIKPAGPARAGTITYDPDPNEPLMYEDYEMHVEEIFVYEADNITS